MLTVQQKEKLAKAKEHQQQLIEHLAKTTNQLVKDLALELASIDFHLEERERTIKALKESELVCGPIEAKLKQQLILDQEVLEKKLLEELEQSRKALEDFTVGTKDLKKYNLKNVR